jgi:hypothetical protein
MKTTAVRLALALYPTAFRDRFGAELLTTMADASHAGKDANASDDSPVRADSDGPRSAAGCDVLGGAGIGDTEPAGSHDAPVHPPLPDLDYRDVVIWHNTDCVLDCGVWSLAAPPTPRCDGCQRGFFWLDTGDGLQARGFPNAQ